MLPPSILKRDKGTNKTKLSSANTWFNKIHAMFCMLFLKNNFILKIRIWLKRKIPIYFLLFLRWNVYNSYQTPPYKIENFDLQTQRKTFNFTKQTEHCVCIKIAVKCAISLKRAYDKLGVIKYSNWLFLGFCG